MAPARATLPRTQAPPIGTRPGLLPGPTRPEGRSSFMRFRSVVLLIALVCCLPASASAGKVFGDIKLGDKPVPAGVAVSVARAPADAKAQATPLEATKTDEFGAYKLMVKEPGKCILTVEFEKQTASIEVFSNKEATRYDLILEKKEGKLSLRRK